MEVARSVLSGSMALVESDPNPMEADNTPKPGPTANAGMRPTETGPTARKSDSPSNPVNAAGANGSEGSSIPGSDGPKNDAPAPNRVAKAFNSFTTELAALFGRGAKAGNAQVAQGGPDATGKGAANGSAVDPLRPVVASQVDPRECDVSTYRCPVCNRLVCREECGICNTDNEHWLKLSQLGHILRFPFIIWILVILAVVAQALWSWSLCRSQDPPYSIPLISAAVLSFFASILIVVLVVVFRRGLRNHELVRQAKRKRRGMSLVALGALCFGALLLILAIASAVSFTVRDYVMGGPWTLTIQEIGGVPRRVFAPNSAQISLPQWSPESDKLLFSSNRDGDGDWEIYTYEVVTGTINMLTDNTTQDILPAWLKDGSIVYASDRTGDFEWYRMDGSGEKNAVGPLGEWRETVSLSWSADGSRYAFTEPGRAAYFSVESLLTLEEKHPLIGAIAASVMFPLLVLSLMLFGAAGYVKKLDDEINRPIFLNDRKTVKVAFDSFLEEMKTRSRDEEFPHPSHAQADVYSFERTASGGVEMIISYKVEVEEKDDKGGKRMVTKEVFYRVQANEWAEVRSIQKLDPRRVVLRQL